MSHEGERGAAGRGWAGRRTAWGLAALGAALTCGCSNEDVVYVTLPERDAPSRAVRRAEPLPDSSPRVTDAGGGATPEADAGPPNVNVERSRCDAPASAEVAKNVILLLADGYGPAQIEATRMFVNGNAEPLGFETLPHQVELSTHDAQGIVTDSAASATAMATGVKVDNYVVSLARPGTGADLTTALEIQKARGKSTGLVTAHAPMTDATPAAFGAHSVDRFASDAIAAGYLEQTRPNVLFGGAAPGFSAETCAAASYVVVDDPDGLESLGPVERVAGVFDEASAPSLADQARVALEQLSRNPEGFFVLVEQEETDTQGHAQNLEGVLAGAVEFVEAVDLALAWSESRDDTLVIVGADHETGGLTVDATDPEPGVVPPHAYESAQHTDAPVRFFARGPGAERLEAMRDNADLFPLLAGHLSAVFDREACEPGIVASGVLSERLPRAGASSSTLLSVQSGPGERQQGLLRFDTDFSELPPGAELASARLYLRSRSPNTSVRLHRLLVEWSGESTWLDFGGDGIQADGRQAVAEHDAETGPLPSGFASVDVTESVRRWRSEPGSNLGWLLLPGNGGGLAAFDSSDRSVPPRLVVHYE